MKQPPVLENAMPFIPALGGIKAEMRYTQDGQRVENVFWFLGPIPNMNLSDLQDVAQMLFDWWDSELKTLQTSAVVLREIYVTDQTTATGLSFTYTTGLPANGANVNTPSPNNVTLTVSLRTQMRGRSFRGRSYVIGITTNTVVASRVTSAAVAAWQAAYDVLVSEAAASGHQMVVASFRTGGNPRVNAVLTPVIDAVIVDDVVDSQRRRLPGRGQ